MNLFKKLDNYLLHYYPTIWITRIHSFLPIGLGLAAILFFTTISFGWNPKDDMPGNATAIVLMIIPVLIYLVYWFIFQSRYNVAKSGGRMTLGLEYVNFFSYLLVFLTAFLLISAIPLGNYHRMHHAVSEEEFNEDIRKLNAGNSLMFSSCTFHENGTITYYPSEFVYLNYYNDYDFAYEYSEPYVGSVGEVSVTRSEAREIMSDFIKTYNKYTHDPIHESASELLAEYEQDFYNGYGSYNTVYMEDSWSVQYKLSQVYDSFHDGSYGEYSEPWFWKIVFAIIAMLTSLVWAFKQMKLRQFIFGFIALCVTPLLIGIVAVILFEVIGLGEDEEIISFIVLCCYVLLAIISIRAFTSTTLHNTGYVMTMYLQFFLPLLPIFLWLFFIGEHYTYFNSEEAMLNFFYWSGWCIGLTCIAAFKPLYTKFRSLPAKN